MNRAIYLKHLEQDLESLQQVVNDLTKENYELKEQIRNLIHKVIENETK